MDLRLVIDGPDISAVTGTQMEAVIQAGLTDGKVLVELPAFTGDGVTKTFDTGISIPTMVMVDPIVGGVPQRGPAYTTSGSSITFAEAPAAGVKIFPRLVAAVDALSAVLSVAGKTGAVTLTIGDVGGLQAALEAKQAMDTTLTALAALAGAGLIRAAGTDSFVMQAVGAASATDILDRAAGDGRYSQLGHGHDAAAITSGVFDLARIPAAALERLVLVADQTARYALTVAVASTTLSGDLCTGGTATASGQQGGYEASKAFDDSTATAWYSSDGTGSDDWIAYQFPQAYAIREVDITSSTAGGGAATFWPTSWLLQSSPDGSSWTTVATLSKAQDTTLQTFSIPASTARAHWRLLCNSSQSNNIAVGEIAMRAYV